MAPMPVKRTRHEPLSTDAIELVAARFRTLARGQVERIDQGLVGRRQDGNSVYYSIADPTVFTLCDAVCSSIGTRLTQHAALAAELRRRSRRR